MDNIGWIVIFGLGFFALLGYFTNQETKNHIMEMETFTKSGYIQKVVVTPGGRSHEVWVKPGDDNLLIIRKSN